MVDLLIVDIPIYPSIHPDKIISPLVFKTEIYDLCCFVPETVTI